MPSLRRGVKHALNLGNVPYAEAPLGLRGCCILGFGARICCNATGRKDAWRGSKVRNRRREGRPSVLRAAAMNHAVSDRRRRRRIGAAEDAAHVSHNRRRRPQRSWVRIFCCRHARRPRPSAVLARTGRDRWWYNALLQTFFKSSSRRGSPVFPYTTGCLKFEVLRSARNWVFYLRRQPARR